MAIKMKKGYAVSPLTVTKLQDFKDEGFRIFEIKTQIVNARAICMEKGTEVYIALTKRGFEGNLDLQTNVVFGNNSDGEKRMYLTNESGVVAIGADW